MAQTMQLSPNYNSEQHINFNQQNQQITHTQIPSPNQSFESNFSQLPSPQPVDLNSAQFLNYGNYLAFPQSDHNALPMMIMSACMPGPSSTTSQQPKTKEFAGTLAYLSPERLDVDQGYSYPSDIWARGIIIYEMVTGHSPDPTTDKPIIQGENMRK